ncbi:TetR family transcriptional regulator [Cohnella kolymensis]|uniref:TetR family transcriptional regulator n=1 Tax=Cohnella kolymensis TaxID=1590652 RepID=A0ABR5A5X4_9BACL|nr:TetR/AcrR family transcriptional regulator [Cohnella kolymensis]KIL36322.1 TetR family transcriptional regulator [Cohnella kolymensis]
MSEKMDRRQARTKQLLRTALMELIEEKGMENITVTDISNRASINRGTFYLHYRDVAEMLEQLKEELFKDLMKYMLQVDFVELMKHAAKDEPYPVSVRIFEEISRNADFFKVIVGPKGDPAFPLRIKQMMTTHIYGRLTAWQPKEENMLVPKDYLIAHVTSANFGVLLHWVETGMKETPKELGLILTRLLNHGPLNSSGLKTIN